MKFLEELKKELQPEKAGLKELDIFIKKINGFLKKTKIEANCIKGGSTAKGTYIKGDHDVDLFVVFDYSYKAVDISKILFEVLKPLKPEVVHGSRDYFQIKQKGMTYEIVPVLDVRDPERIENVTDMSPLHVEWVNNRLNDDLRDEIRLSKKFCKAIKAYGAESYIKGFSGHVIDILVIYYGSFLNFLKAASNWKPKVIVDIEKKYREPLKEIGQSKTFGPLVVVDPVQPKRNAAAAISQEKFDRLVNAAKNFLKNPSKDFFAEKEFDIKDVKKKAKKYSLLHLKLAALKGKTDAVGAKLLKVYEHLKSQLQQSDFTVIESDWKWDKKESCEMYFTVKEKLLPETFVRKGPPLKEKEACESFKEKNKNVFEKQGRLFANVKRKFRNPKELMKDLLKSDYIKERVKKAMLK